MRKIKKTATSFIYLLLLVAFTGVVGLEFGPVSMTKQRDEISQANLHSGLILSIIPEEEEDPNDQQLLMLPVDLFITTFIFFVAGFFLFIAQQDFENSFHKNSLFILFRSLRL